MTCNQTHFISTLLISSMPEAAEVANPSILEEIRTLHSDLEQCYRSITPQLLINRRTLHPRHIVLMRHYICEKLLEAQKTSRTLVEIYRGSDITTLRSPDSNTLPVALQQFQGEMQKIIKHTASRGRLGERSEQNIPMCPITPYIESTVNSFSRYTTKGKFSGEEGFGQYLDLIEAHQAYVQLWNDFSQEVKESASVWPITYKVYLERYLSDFEVLPKYIRLIPDEFVVEEDEKHVSGSQAYCDYLSYLGNTLRDAHLRLFPLEGTCLLEKEARFSLSSATKNSGECAITDKSTIESTWNILKEKSATCRALMINQLEDRVRFWISQVGHRLIHTIRRQENKITITPEELMDAELREEDAMRESVLKTNELIDYTQGVLLSPDCSTLDKEKRAVEKEELGWDGNKIPVWLRKAHGLKVKQKCEICGKIYAGPQIFEQHFKESFHISALARLGIPNTPHLHGITSVNEATILWQKLCSQLENQKQEQWKPDDEELEDREGQTLRRGQYLELKRQRTGATNWVHS